MYFNHKFSIYSVSSSANKVKVEHRPKEKDRPERGGLFAGA